MIRKILEEIWLTSEPTIVMSGIIGAKNQFGHDFGNPDPNMQGIIVSIYDVRNMESLDKLGLTLDRLVVRSEVSVHFFSQSTWEERR